MRKREALPLRPVEGGVPTRRLVGLEGGVFLADFTMGGGSQGGVVQSQTLIIEVLSSSSLFTPCEPCSFTEPQFPCLSVLMDLSQ